IATFDVDFLSHSGCEISAKVRTPRHASTTRENQINASSQPAIQWKYITPDALPLERAFREVSRTEQIGSRRTILRLRAPSQLSCSQTRTQGKNCQRSFRSATVRTRHQENE